MLLAAAVALATLAPAGELCLYDCGTVGTHLQCSAAQRSAVQPQLLLMFISVGHSSSVRYCPFLLRPAGVQLQTEVVVEGSALELLCVGGADWQVWDVDGSDVSTCGGYCTVANESLVFRAVLRQHQGRYSCLLGAVTYLVTVIG